MSPRQRRLRRRHRRNGGVRRGVLVVLGMAVIGAFAAARQRRRLHRRRGLRRARHPGAQAGRPGRQLRGVRQQWPAPGLHRERRGAPARHHRQAADVAEAGDDRDRGRALLQAQGRRLRGRRQGRDQEPALRRDGAGRLHADDAARAQHLSDRAQARLQAQDQGGQARPGARGRASQGLDPHQLPQQRAVRDRRRAHRDRRRGGRARVLRQARQQADAAGGGNPGRLAPGALALQPVPRSARRALAPQRRAAPDEEAAHDQRRRVPAGGRRPARRQEQRLLLHQARELLLRLRQGAADRALRPGDRAQGRAEDLHDDRPRQAEGGALGDEGAAPVQRRSLLGDRVDRSAQRLHPRDGVVLQLPAGQVQLRRPGAPPGGVDLQGHGADGGLAQGHQPEHARRTSRTSWTSTPRTGRGRSTPTRTATAGR